MSLPTKVDAYPVGFHELAARGYQVDEPFTVEFDTESEAIGFRFQWYGFLKALDADARVQPPQKDEFGNIVPHPLKIEAQNGRALMVGQKGNTLTFTPREITPLGANIDRVNMYVADLIAKKEAKNEAKSTTWVAERKKTRLKKQANTRAEVTEIAQTSQKELDEIEAMESEDRTKRLAILANLTNPEEEPEVEKTL